MVWEVKKLSPDEFARFRDFLYGATGIRMQDGKITLLSNRIRRRLKMLGIESFADYYARLTSGSLRGELEHFIDAVTTNETHFFRHGSHFDWFRGAFIDDLLARERAGRHERTLRIWSAACSSGEELYSLAICLDEAAARMAGWTLALLGTDISETVLAVAREGRYSRRSVEQLSPTQLRRHFTEDPAGEHWTIRTQLRSRCEFRRHNLLEPMRGARQDLVLVRNVMIYFDRDSKKVAVRHLIEALAPGGFLVVGPADGIFDLLDGLEKVSPFLYRKPVS
jgi:chemotaxis protein methyltransferase CheR